MSSGTTDTIAALYPCDLASQARSGTHPGKTFSIAGKASYSVGTEVCFATATEVAKSYDTPAPTWPSTGVKEHTVRQVATSVWHDVTITIIGNGAYRDPDTVYNFGWDFGSVSVDLMTGRSLPLSILGTAQLKAVDDPCAALKPIAEQIVAAQETGSDDSQTSTLAILSVAFSGVMTAKANHDKELSDANSAYVTGSTNSQSDIRNFKTSVESGGWIMAGPYYMTIARPNTAFMNATFFMPTVGHDSFNPGVVQVDGSPLSDRLFGGNGADGT